MADRIVAVGEADRTSDWRVWREMRAPQLWQCVALSLNINPFKVGTNDDSWYGTPLIFYESQEFQDRLDTACAIFGRDGVPANPRRPVSLHSFAALVRRLGWVAPPELLLMADEQKTSTAEGRASGEPPESPLLPFRAPDRQDDWCRVIRAMKIEFESEHERSPNETEAWARLRTTAPKGYDVKSVTHGNDEAISIGNSVANNPLDKKAFVKRWRRYTGTNKAIKGQ
jgi:hypothetical protein